MHRPAVHRYRAVIASEIVVIGKRREKRLGYPLQFTTASWVLHVAPGGRLVHAPSYPWGKSGILPMAPAKWEVVKVTVDVFAAMVPFAGSSCRALRHIRDDVAPT